MKNIILIIVVLFAISFQAKSQETTTTFEEKIERAKAKLEAQGIKITYNKPDEKNDVHPFIARWTNQTLPTFQLTDIDGKSISSDDLKGKYVHINFWSVTCKPCIEEFPELDEIKEKYGNEEVIYLAIAPEDQKLVEKIIKKRPLNYTVISDADALFEQLGIEGYPKNLFINKEGVIEKITDGTNYKMDMVDGKVTMTPDNFRHYDEIMAGLIK
ncbi:MAG: redoxin domain-containing protein [Bacteroidota bacterium]